MDNSAIADSVILPSQCAVGFGIPTSMNAFEEARNDASRDFAKQFMGGWVQYYAQWVIDFDDFARAVKPWGVKVITELDLAGYGSVLRDESVSVFVLFSHWDKEGVEFHDGLVPFSVVAHNVPEDFTGILDLCVCHPTPLVDELLATRTKCLVRYIPRKAKTAYWLHYYKALLRLLKNGDRTYPGAMSELTIELLKWAKEK